MFHQSLAEESTYSSTDTLQLEGGIIYDENGIIFLDKSIKHPTLNIKTNNTLIPVYIPENTDSRIRTRSALARASKLSGEEYYMTTIFNYVDEHNGPFSYGTYYGASMDNAQMTYTTTFFSRFDTKKFGIMTTVSSDTQAINGSYQGMFGIAPELKITKYLTLRDTIKTYMGVPIKKNQISLIYKPQFKRHLENLWLELGLSQTFYENGTNNTSLELSTRFKL